MGCLRKTNHIIVTFLWKSVSYAKLYTPQVWIHTWQWAALELGGKNKISYKCSNEGQNNYTETTAPCKSILPWVQQFEVRSSIKRGTWCKLPSVPPAEVSYEAGICLELKKVSMKRKAKSSSFLDLWCMNCCTNTWYSMPTQPHVWNNLQMKIIWNIKNLLVLCCTIWMRTMITRRTTFHIHGSINRFDYFV